MVIDKIVRESVKSEIGSAIDGVIHHFEHIQSFSKHNLHESIKDAIEHHRSYKDRYYRRMLHNEFSASPIPAMVALRSVMAS